MEKYYLSSLESKKLSFVRECQYIREISFTTGKAGIIAKINEPLQWQDAEGFHLSEFVILAQRHEGYAITKIKHFPTFVYVSVLKANEYEGIDIIEKNDLIVIGVGELYRSFEDAQNHHFD